MVKITEELVRKRSEHNECIIGTLEELSLHQEDIEKIEHLQNWCKKLEILYLQANVIGKIENLNKLKDLKYLNLAINNIEIIENLERCDSLEKLDLTLNFIGKLESVKSLKNNINLKELLLTGNPCCEFQGYRGYVIAVLPQLQTLDVQEITRSEQIKAQQNFHINEHAIRIRQNEYLMFREEQRKRLSVHSRDHLTDEEFWKSTSENAPETRAEIAQRSKRSRKNVDINEKKPVKNIKLFAKDGRPLNINQAKLDFVLNDENPSELVLDLAVYKFLDTSLIDIDLQPIYVKITVKNKIFQIVFPEEISVDKSVAQRSQTTGHLVLKMPKANYKIGQFSKAMKPNKPVQQNTKPLKRNEYLEIEEKEIWDISKIVEGNLSQKFVDNAEVPPLEYA